MQSYGFIPEYVDIITAIIVYFAAFSLLAKTLIGKAFRRDDGNANAEIAPIAQVTVADVISEKEVE